MKKVTLMLFFAISLNNMYSQISWMGNEYTTLGTTQYLGDQILFEIQSYPQGSNQGAQVYIDWNNDGYGSTQNIDWFGLNWIANVGNNSKWNAYVTMKNTGTHNRRYLGWQTGQPDHVTGNFGTFTVSPLNTPTSQTATTNSSTAIDLSWAKNAQNHNVMIVRYAKGATETAPTNGTTYAINSTIGSGTVIYNGSETTSTNSSLSSSREYDYYFYSENNSYYSTGVKATGSTSSAAGDNFKSITNGNWNTVGTWYSSSDNSNWVTSTLVPGSSAASVTVSESHTVTVDINATALAINNLGIIEVNASKQLTVGTLTNNGTFTLKTGATVLTTNIAGSGTTNVEQLLSSDRQWWYLSSPVSTAQTTIFNTNSNKIGYYDETIFNYTNPITATENLTIGRGYLVKLAGTTGGTYTFTGGSLNNGNIAITPTRTGTANAKRGFNLIGNPYPSYIDWDAIYHDDTNPATNLRDAIWFRTYSSGMTFHTYSDGEAVPTSSGVTGKIAPMQGFWVKVHADGSNGSLTFKNAHRSHYTETGYNPLKAKAIDDRQRVRLVLSDGTNIDETLIVAKSYASDNQDAYDIEKMSNESADISEIFSMIGTEAMVINSVAPITAGKTVTLGIRSTSEKAYNITASQLQNIPIDVRVILVDAGAETETELSEGVSYNFVASAGDVNNRFSIQFRSQGTTTQVDSDSKNQILAFSNSQQQIEIISTESLPAGTKICVFNTAGQTITQMLAAGTRIKIPATMSKGIYFCHIENATQNLQYKVIVR